jgi:hypothetical protein
MNADERATYHKVTRTITCPYCMKLRTSDNIHTYRPRVKCKPCFAARSERFKQSLRNV